MDIKLPMQITDTKGVFSFSTLQKLHHNKLFDQWLAFSWQHYKISQLFQHLRPNSGPKKSKHELQDFSVPEGTLTTTVQLTVCCLDLSYFNEWPLQV